MFNVQRFGLDFHRLFYGHLLIYIESRYIIKRKGNMVFLFLENIIQVTDMPIFLEGIYSKTEDYPYEVETTYQLKYYILAALVSINCILEPVENMIDKFENEIQFYRYYVDNLFYYLGLINERFVCKSNIRDKGLDQEKVNRIAHNKINYQFTELDFNILSNKRPRNIIEHLDERNVKTILDNNGVGGFNVIFSGHDSEVVESIRRNRKYYPYILDLHNKKVLFYDAQAKQNEAKQFEIDISELQNELRKLEKNVKSFAGFLKIN